MTDKIYAERPVPYAVDDYGPDLFSMAQMNDYADATHALRTKAQPVGDEREAFESSFTAIAKELGDQSDDCEFEKASDSGYCNGFMQIAWLVWQARAALAAQAPQPAITSESAAPQQAAPAVGNSGFDHRTAASILDGKAVSDEYIRKFVQASRWAHDDRASIQATLQSVRGELASREAEIALLKTALMEAEAAPQQEVQAVDDLAKELDTAREALQWYMRRCEQLQRVQTRMRDPERTMVCDILANGSLLVPDGQRYTAQPAPSGDAWKDGDTAALVNQLRDVALQYRDTQQLRERIAHIVRPLVGHVQNQPKNEHIAGDVSKSGQESNMSDAEDTALLDWLDQNIFHREMNEWDAKYGGRGEQNMWVLFAPKGVRGSARNIINAARKEGK